MQPAKILIVDDTPENIDLLRKVLTPLQCKVLVATTGESALELLLVNQPDLILLDVMMPGIDGFETCKRIRKDPKTHDIPVIFVTGRQDDIKAGFDVGGNDYITKPINNDEVKARVNHHLERLKLLTNLQKLNDELEDKVRERTAALAVTNRQLREEINERRYMQDRLRYLAEHDFVTRLYNRNALDTFTTEVISKVQRLEQEASFLQVDIDQFRLINESCGCIAGDELLREVAEIIAGCIASQDFLARLGADKFAVLCPDKDRTLALALAKRIQQTLAQHTFLWEGRQFNLASSIAIVTVDSDILGFDQLLLMADEVLYLAKREGRNSIKSYDDSISKAVSHRNKTNWALRLVDALKHQHMQVYVQEINPLHNTAGNKVKYEALVRLVDPKADNVIYPDEFIPAAERFNLICDVDRYVILQVSKFLASCHDIQEHIESISINLSAISLRDPDLKDYIVKTVNEHGISARQIIFEITETENIVNIISTRNFMEQLKNLGFRFSLDDFGSGYASFNYLKELPFDIVKIDGIFVKDMDKLDTHASMVRSIVEIAKKLNKEIIAEFVETESTVNMLREMQVDWAQGYLYHRPELLTRDLIESKILSLKKAGHS